MCCATLETETIACKFGQDYAIALKQVLKELIQLDVPIVNRIDSNQLFTTTHTTKMVADPTLRRTVALIRQNVWEDRQAGVGADISAVS